VDSKKRKKAKAHQPHFSSENCTDILEKVNEALTKNKDHLKKNPSILILKQTLKKYFIMILKYNFTVKDFCVRKNLSHNDVVKI
jgi:hypothetical protein